MSIKQEILSIPIFPLNVVLFPGSQLSLHIFEEKYRLMFRHVLEGDGAFGVVRRDFSDGKVASVGCIARVVEVEKLSRGRLNICAEGDRRFELLELDESDLFPRALIRLCTPGKSGAREKLLSSELRGLLDDLLRLSARVTGQRIAPTEVWPAEPEKLSYLVPATFYGSPSEQQKLLELDDVARRLSSEIALLQEARKHLAAQSAIEDAFKS
ncbi:ATP-dependent protease [bacterium]|nr:ATP-dependent protease [bacterium]